MAPPALPAPAPTPLRVVLPNQPVRRFLHDSAVAAAPATARFRSLSLGTPAHQVARQRRNLGPAAEPLQRDFSPYGYTVIGGPLESIFATIGEFTDLGVPETTLLKDDLSWRRWVRYCRLAGTSPWRMDRNAHSGADAAGFDRESRLLCAFLIWCYDDIQPRSKSDPAPKPESAYAMVCGVRRIHRRHNVSMVSCTQLSAVLKGLTKAFILEHGAEALLPARRDPLGPDLLRRLLRTPKGTVLGTTRVDWNSTIFLCLGGMFALGGGTGFRKSEVALPSQTAFDDRRLSRASVLWLIDGTLYNDPSAAQLRSLVPGRDFMLIKPPRSKADQDGTKFGALPIYLPFNPADVANAAHWIQRLELRFPRHGNQRRTTPLFFEDAVSFRPMSHATVDRLLKQLLRVELPEAEAHGQV